MKGCKFLASSYRKSGISRRWLRQKCYNLGLMSFWRPRLRVQRKDLSRYPVTSRCSGISTINLSPICLARSGSLLIVFS
jgi:hypothetical protein